MRAAREVWFADQPDLDPTRLIFIDETGLNTKMARMRGRCRIRKFGVSLTLSHQYLNQLSLSLRDAVLGSVGTKIVFRVGLADAEALRHEFPVNNTFPSVAELAPHSARISTPVGEYQEDRMPTLPNERSVDTAEAIRRHSRRHYTRSPRRVEWRIG